MGIEDDLSRLRADRTEQDRLAAAKAQEAQDTETRLREASREIGRELVEALQRRGVRSDRSLKITQTRHHFGVSDTVLKFSGPPGWWLPGLHVPVTTTGAFVTLWRYPTKRGEQCRVEEIGVEREDRWADYYLGENRDGVGYVWVDRSFGWDGRLYLFREAAVRGLDQLATQQDQPRRKGWFR
jgi:hypothetical protein